MSLDNVVNITISRSAAAVSRQGFGTALILGVSASGWGTDRIRKYNAPSEMLDDGFTSGDMEYKEALRLYGQPVRPAQFKVGLRKPVATQVNTVTPDVTNQAIQDFKVTINGVTYSMTSSASPTASAVVTGLITAINAGTDPITASGTTTLVLTSDVPGIGFSVVLTPNLSQVVTTPNVGIAIDLAQIKAIDDDWYALILCDRTPSSILEAASFIEGERKIFVAATSDAGVGIAGSSDIASQLKLKGYNRTFLIFTADQASGPEGALLGNILPRVVGSYTAKFKTLVGITADVLSATQFSQAKLKNANVHTIVAGAGMLEEGVVSSGEFLDVIIGADWILVNMQADVFQALRDAPKIPYNNQGTATIQNVVSKRLQLAVTAGILTEDPAYVVIAPLIADQDPADKATRTIGGMSFVAYLAGAVHAVRINGSVLVA